MTQKNTQYILIVMAILLSIVGSYFGVALPAPALPTPELSGADVDTKAIAPTKFQAVEIKHGLTVGGDVTVDGDLSVDGLYPVGNYNEGKELVCGTTATFTGSTTISTRLSAVDVVIATQITVPAATKAFLIASEPTTSTITLYSKNSTYGAGTTGLKAYYCVLGDK